MLLQDKIIAITGAGTGIGKAIALAIAAEGATTMVTDVNEKWAEQVAEEVNKGHGKAVFSKLDVLRQAEAGAVVDRIVRQFGRLDIWINNAGVSNMKPFIDLTEEDWDFNMDVNAKGAFLCSQVAARQLMKNNPLR